MTQNYPRKTLSVWCGLYLFLLLCMCNADTLGPPKDGQPYIHEVISYTQKTPEKLVALSMLSDEDHVGHMVFQPTALPTTTQSSETTSIVPNITLEEPKGRALNFSLEHSHENGLSSNASSFDKFGDLSDVSMDGDDEDDSSVQMGKILAPKNVEVPNKTKYCEKGGLSYENGEKLEIGCDSICTCIDGRMDCKDRCTGPLFRKGKKIDDPLCTEKPSDDPCCSSMICAADTETEPLELCHFNNKTYNKGDIVEKGCDEVCTCETGGRLSCKNRCPPIDKKTDDKCVIIPDSKDPCCKAIVCDVTLDDVDHDPFMKDEDSSKPKIISAKYVNETSIKIKFGQDLNSSQVLPLIEASTDKMSWQPFRLLPNGLINVSKSDILYVRLDHSEDLIPVQNFKLENNTNSSAEGCEFKGKKYKEGDEFHDECESFCACTKEGVKCLKMECPTYFGVDVLDPTCVEWETVPSNFTPVAPNCCPEKLVCKNNGSCEHKGEMYQNWQQLPLNVTGCENRCYCEMGKIECQKICPPVPAVPPHNLPCGPQNAMLGHLDDDCCLEWICSEMTSNEGNNTNEVIKQTNETSVPYFGVPAKQPSKVLGPLVVYTNKDGNNSTPPVLPTVTPDENPFFHKNNNDDAPKTKKPGKMDKPIKEEHPLYAGPIHPDYKTPGKPILGNKGGKEKVKPTKTSQDVFVTPPSNINENYIPEYNSQVPFAHAEDYPLPGGKGPNKDNTHQVVVHGKGNPDEILQIINQHPEFANYPPGSVLEIHNVPHQQNQQFANPNEINPGLIGQRQPIIPYVVNEQQAVPHGVHLEHILQEIQKNQPHTFIPYPQHPHQQYPTQNDGLFVAQSNGHVFNNRPNHNITSSTGVNGNVFPPGFPGIPGFNQPQDGIVVHTLEALDAHTVRLAFTVPSIIVGLHGRVEVRYTHEASDDTNTWQQQVFAPPNDLIPTPQLEFDLVDLLPDTEYKIKISITLRDMNTSPSSKVYSIRTLKDTAATPSMLSIEPELVISEVNSTWVNVAWRKFWDNELQYIDGVQLRYREIDEKIYAATPLIHRAVTNYVLENLKPSTKYEIGIFFIPFPGQTIELHADHMIHFTTANKLDSYGFNVTLEISHIKPTSVEISWSGVPYPEDKYVNIYRAIYQSDSGKGDSSTFKIAKRDAPSKTIIMDLKPGTRYRLWLEVYLTNGQIKTSNVQDFITKPRSLASTSSSKSDKLERELTEEDNYYGPLVIVAILAAIAIMCTMVLLLMLVRRHSQNKAAITTPPPRVSQSAYDNPTYKVEIQQETMNL